MSAYSVSLKHVCRLCGVRAAVEVFNTWNASQGFYCAKHGAERVRVLNLREKHEKQRI